MILQRQSRARIVVVGSPYVFDPKVSLLLGASFAPVQAVIGQRVAQGVFRPLDTWLITHTFFGLLAQLSKFIDEVPANYLLEQLVDLLTLGIHA